MAVHGGSPRLVILLPMVWSIRNVVYSGVLEYLADAGVTVTLLMRDLPPDVDASKNSDFAFAEHCERLIFPKHQRRLKGRSLLREILKSAHNKRNRIASYAIYQRWITRHYTKTQRLYQSLVEFLSILFLLPGVFPMGCRFYCWMQTEEMDVDAIEAQLRRLKPDAIWSTVNVEIDFEHAYKMAAEKLHIPVVTSILSFDNLTSKSLHLNYLHYDHYLVWNGRMKDQLLQFFPHVSMDQVTITGTPQFDFHRRPEYLWTREDTLRELGLPQGARYFLYTSSVDMLAPVEPELVVQLVQRLKNDPVLKDYWMVVRHHPKDGADRWSAVQMVSDRVKLSHPWSTYAESSSDYWTLTTKADQAKLVSSLAYAEACLNIASTTSLDAAILDKPVIGIRFDGESDAPSDILYEEYDATHFKPLVDSGGLRVARTWNELLSLMRRALEQPSADQIERASMVELEGGIVDGNAAKRTAQALTSYLDSSR